MQQHPIILFDGFCNFCSASVWFVLKKDREAVFQFASMQSDTGKKILKQQGLEETQTVILIDTSDVSIYSTAALNILRRLPGFRILSKVLLLIPLWIRDPIYQWVARNRYKWWGKRESCFIPDANQRARFIE